MTRRSMTRHLRDIACDFWRNTDVMHTLFVCVYAAFAMGWLMVAAVALLRSIP